MIIDLNEVTKMIQALLEDPAGTEFDSGYLLPFINLRYNDIVIALDQLDLSYEEIVAIITSVAATTADLSAFQVTGQALAGLLLPMKVEWKLVGEPDTSYVEVGKVDVLPDVDASAQGISAWEWRGSTIYVTPSSVAVTLRVRFQALSSNLVDPTDSIISGTTSVLAYKVAELMAMSRGNDKLKTDMIRLGTQAMDDFSVLAVKNNQKQTRKFGRFSRRLRGPRYIAR